MSLLFDLSATQSHYNVARHGGAKYGEAIFHKLLETSISISVCYNFELAIDKDIEQAITRRSIKCYNTSKQSIISVIASDKNIETFYTALPIAVIPDIIRIGKVGIRVIGTIHGLRDIELWPDLKELRFCSTMKEKLKFAYKFMFHDSYVKRRKRIFSSLINAENFEFITDSKHSKYSLLANFPELKEESIKVYYCPSTSKNIGFEKASNFKSYFLMVSGNRYLKNNDIALQALDELFSERSSIPYTAIITGVTDNIVKRLKLKHPDKFQCIGYVSDSDLSKLYGNAYCLIYPSLNEGFGYPPIEAMEFGVPIIASPLTSIPEICGSAPIYFNPFSKMELKNRILQILDPIEWEIHSKKSVLRYEHITTQQFSDLQKIAKYIAN